MKIKKILLTFLLLVCLDQLTWRFVWNDDRPILSSVSFCAFFSLVWLIPIKTKKEVDAQFVKNLVLSANEQLSLASTANKIDDAEVMGGRLFLTDKRLVFISTGANVRNRQLDFTRDEIVSVERHPQFPKAIVITTSEQITHVFNVDKHQEWKRELVTGQVS